MVFYPEETGVGLCFVFPAAMPREKGIILGMLAQMLLMSE